jgi:hypothetical protein
MNEEEVCIQCHPASDASKQSLPAVTSGGFGVEKDARWTSGQR